MKHKMGVKYSDGRNDDESLKEAEEYALKSRKYARAAIVLAVISLLLNGVRIICLLI